MAAVAGGIIQIGDYNTLANYTIYRPLVKLVAQSAQNLNSATLTAILFGAGSEDIDTHGFHDPVSNTSRITPNVPGYYRFSGTLWLSGAVTLQHFYAGVSKNGTLQNPINRVKPNTATTAAQSAQTGLILPMNGSTDYVELIGNQTDSGAAVRATTTGAGTVCVFEAEFLRPL